MAVTPPSPGWPCVTAKSAMHPSPTDRPRTPTGAWHGPAFIQAVLGMELLDHRGWGWAARDIA